MATLCDINSALHAEYALRRRMLIERVKVTLASFLYRCASLVAVLAQRRQLDGGSSSAAAAEGCRQGPVRQLPNRLPAAHGGQLGAGWLQRRPLSGQAGSPATAFLLLPTPTPTPPSMQPAPG